MRRRTSPKCGRNYIRAYLVFSQISAHTMNCGPGDMKTQHCVSLEGNRISRILRVDVDVSRRIVSHLLNVPLLAQIVEHPQGRVGIQDDGMQIYQVRRPKMCVIQIMPTDFLAP